MSALVSTAHWTAAARAAETLRPDGLFRDHVALTVAAKGDPSVLRRLRTERNPHYDYFAVRTRFFDDLLAESAADPRRNQVVLLAAGMDSRAFRLDLPASITLYELDLPALFAEKEPMLERLGTTPRCRRTVVPADLTGQWQSRLQDAGFDPRLPTVWIVEGLFYYLTSTQADVLLEQLSTLSAPESVLGVEHVNPDMIEAPSQREWQARFTAQRSPWRSSVAAPEAWLATAGWTATVREAGDLPFADNREITLEPRSVPGVPRAWLIRAELAT